MDSSKRKRAREESQEEAKRGLERLKRKKFGSDSKLEKIYQDKIGDDSEDKLVYLVNDEQALFWACKVYEKSLIVACGLIDENFFYVKKEFKSTGRALDEQ